MNGIILWATGAGLGAQVKSWLAIVYHFILSLGGPGLFFLALADSSFLSIPEGNDVLIVVLSTGQTWSRMTYYALMTTAGSAAGCSLLYLVGRRGGRFVERRMESSRRVREVQRLYQRWGSLAIVIPSVLPPPTPFKIFVLSAGLFGVTFPRFVTAVLVGRSIRYFFWGVLAVLYGELAKEFLERHFHVVGLVVLGLIVILCLWFLLFRARGRRKAPQSEAI